jgi:hypothetical protein
MLDFFQKKDKIAVQVVQLDMLVILLLFLLLLHVFLELILLEMQVIVHLVLQALHVFQQFITFQFLVKLDPILVEAQQFVVHVQQDGFVHQIQELIIYNVYQGHFQMKITH